MNFSNLTGFKKYFSNTFWALLERAVRFILGLLIGIYVARYLGPQLFGVYNFAISFTSLIILFSTLGLDKIVVKAIVRKEASTESILGTALVLRLVAAVGSILCIILFIEFFNAEQAKAAVYIISITSLFQAFDCIDLYFQAKVKIKYVAIIKIIQSLAGALSKLILITIEADLIWFIWVLVLEAAILAFGLYWTYKIKVGDLIVWKWDKQLAKKLLLYSWPLVLSTVFIAINLRIDQILIQQLLGSEAVGYYAAVSRLSEASYNICVLIVAALFPAIVNSKSISEIMYYNRIKNLYSLMFFMALSISLLITIFAEPLIILLYGMDYIQSAQVFAIHIWTAVFVYWGIIMNQWAIMENRQKHMAFFMFIGIIINIILNLLLVPVYGINGAAIATLISQIMANMIIPLFFGQPFREQIGIQLKSMFHLPMPHKVV